MQARFPLYNFAGTPITYLFVDGSPVQVEAVEEPQISHHIIIVDRSGSMYSDMPALRTTLLKLLTLDEYAHSEMRVTLISYSSQGDMSVHFHRVTIEEVMAPGSVHYREIENLRVTGLTCISQALAAAKELVKDDEVTAITLHSDGYANDRSPSSERQVIDKIVAGFKGMDHVFINTIAYSMWSDFQLLAGIANAASGKCVQATKIRDVYDALHETSKLLAGKMTPAILLPLDGADYQVFKSADGKINGGAQDLVIKGVKPDAQKDIFRYRAVSQAEYEASTLPVCGEGAGDAAIYAYARAQLAEGNLNRAKYALMATRDGALIGNHYRALTGSEIAGFMAGLDEVLFRHVQHPKTANYGLGQTGISILELLALMGEYASTIQVDMKALRGVYTKQGLKRVDGVRDENGEIIPPKYHTEFTADADFMDVRSFDLNRDTATINMLVTRPVRLMEGSTPIMKVAGVDLGGLRSFNNYTLVSNGSLNVPFLMVKIGSKKLFRALVDAGVLSGDYDPETPYQITLTGMPLVDFSQAAKPITGLFTTLARLKVLNSILEACTKGKSDTLTDEQVAALKDHYLSPSLNFSPPTTNSYTDLDAALASGEVDTKVVYKVQLGTPDIINLSKLHSANKFLDRLFTATQDGKKVAKPTFALLGEPGVTWGYKVLSARTKLTAVDDLMQPIFEDFLGLKGTGALSGIMGDIDADGLVDRITDIPTMDRDTLVEFCKELQRKVASKMDAIYTSSVCPLAFFVGSTGLIPDEFGAKALSVDDLKALYPDLSLGTDERDGTFFVVGDTILSVAMKSEYVSRG